MCGIAGFFGKRVIPAAARGEMLAAIGARGPDARGEMLWDAQFSPCRGGAHAALLHTRLSIRDLREAAGQPMRNEAGDVWVCYNGEVYGWEQEAATLKRAGVAFHTTSDTEFILRGYEAWGLEVIDKLRGMFAIAILDLRRRKLHLIRDRMGIKPLVYFHAPGEIAFGSSVRSVLPYVPADARTFSSAGIDAFLAHRYIPAPHTVYRNIKRLPAGHYASFDLTNASLTIRRYWHPQPRAHIGGLAEAVNEAVKLRTVADRPVGLFLSGGIDSATVGSVLAAQGHRDIRAFTAAFPGNPLDESTQAARIAAALGLPHTALPVHQHIVDDFARIVAALDEPFADPSSFPLWYLAQAATEHVKVVLGGDGGDELFAGYKRYRKHLSQRWRVGWRIPRMLSRAHTLPGRAAKLLDELSMPWAQAYSQRFSGMTPSLRHYLQPELRDMQPVYWWGNDASAPTLSTLLDIDMANYLPEYILRKADLCTMAHGLELRVPLLDHQLYEHVLSMPADQRFTAPAKLALAQACNVCSKLDLFNQPKRGFNPPIAEWLRGDLRGLLSGLALRLENVSDGQLPAARTQPLINRFLAGRNRDAEQVLQLLLLSESLQQLRALA